jgi:hypothetical protein
LSKSHLRVKSSRPQNLGGVCVQRFLQHRALRGGPFVDMAGGRGTVTSGLVGAPLVADGQVKRDRNRGLVGEQYGALAGDQLVAVIIDLAEFHRE